MVAHAMNRDAGPAVDVPMERIEFYRHGMALLPRYGDRSAGVSMLVSNGNDLSALRFCTCAAGRAKTCDHLLEAVRIAAALGKSNAGDLDTRFRSGVWFALAGVLAAGEKVTPDAVQIEGLPTDDGRGLRVHSPARNDMAVFFPPREAMDRFLGRCGNRPKIERHGHRGLVLQRLAQLTLSANERIMASRGIRSRIQGIEQSFWFFAMYHHFLEYGENKVRFRIDLEPHAKRCVLGAVTPEGTPVFDINVRCQDLDGILAWASRWAPDSPVPAVHPLPLQQMLYVDLTPERGLEVTPLFVLAEPEKTPYRVSKQQVEALRCGDLVYLEHLDVFTRIAPLSEEHSARWQEKMVVKRDRVPAFLDQFRTAMENGPYLVSDAVKALRIFDRYSLSTISVDDVFQDGLGLSANYQFGAGTLSLGKILRAKKKKKRFLETTQGWVDLTSKHLDGFDAIIDFTEKPEIDTPLRLTPLEVFRLQAAHDQAPDVVGAKDRLDIFNKMLSRTAQRALPELRGLKATLRGYQQNGVGWLWFLYENRLGGLLCDDMGIGKTHQAMALMVAIAACGMPAAPFLVICPTTVISHWRQKLERYAPDLSVGVYHGPGRDFNATVAGSRVVITSYGLLRRDIERFSTITYPLVVFDEIQHIKNPGTQAYQAAEVLPSDVKLGLTGTPVENSLLDLKALMDIVLPGYFIGRKRFEQRYANKSSQGMFAFRNKELQRLIRPFTLRRLKASVLKELPDKIEDIASCRLAGEQVKQYREAVATRGRSIIETLRDAERQVPYMHVFALLNYLKQICDHPALLTTPAGSYNSCRSGKWELFKELLGEALDSGQKVVVFTQFLGMVKMMEDYLSDLGVGHVSLTGATTDRGKVISTFNADARCRVFVGSLKAGGTGIDLVAGSVVIHYDRWWNAAKEDQATDRVHRIGQRRGVQVFKLVTEGTLEERISGMIEKKRHLAENVLQEDDPSVMKSFSRREIIDMLSMAVPEAEDEDDGDTLPTGHAG